MRLCTWVAMMAGLLTAIPAIADNNYPPHYPPRNDGYSYPVSGNPGPRWYGYYANGGKNGVSNVPENADHTNITEIWATIPLGAPFDDTARAHQIDVATNSIIRQLQDAAKFGQRAMVDLGAIVFIPVSPTGDCTNTCYGNNPNAIGDLKNLVDKLKSTQYKFLISQHPELGTVSSFYVADEPDLNGLWDAPLGVLPNAALLNAVSAIRNNPDTTNFPLATIVSKDGYRDILTGLGLFDWISFDDYANGYGTYLDTLAGFKVITHNYDVVGGTPQHYFMVPGVTKSAGVPYVGGAPPFYQQFENDPSIIGIMPFSWESPFNDDGTINFQTLRDGMNNGSSWVNEYITLGLEVIASNAPPLAPPPPPPVQMSAADITVIVNYVIAQ